MERSGGAQASAPQASVAKASVSVLNVEQCLPRSLPDRVHGGVALTCILRSSHTTAALPLTSELSCQACMQRQEVNKSIQSIELIQSGKSTRIRALL